jgi:hypothetical protein
MPVAPVQNFEHQAPLDGLTNRVVICNPDEGKLKVLEDDPGLQHYENDLK